jgi:hypothetical protein
MTVTFKVSLRSFICNLIDMFVVQSMQDQTKLPPVPLAWTQKSLMMRQKSLHVSVFNLHLLSLNHIFQRSKYENNGRPSAEELDVLMSTIEAIYCCQILLWDLAYFVVALKLSMGKRCWHTSVADERVSTDLKKNIMQARLDKKLTQAQLAQVLMA